MVEIEEPNPLPAAASRQPFCFRRFGKIRCQGFWVLSREGAFGEQLEALTWAGGDALEDGLGRSPCAPEHRTE